MSNFIAEEILQGLMEGNQRFSSGNGSHYTYSPEKIGELARGQAPRAAIVACSDGRVSPEVIFDQPLASLFVSRVPGNVASDSAKWMLEIAVTDLRVPLVVVMGHTECLAIRQVLEGRVGAGGDLRIDIQRAVQDARFKDSGDHFQNSVRQNALQTAQKLRSDSAAVRRAIDEGRLELVSAVYDVFTGKVELLDEVDSSKEHRLTSPFQR